jgi:guanosine-3',5'-bis(diphosphate) 3'-pyrophosphohydrolase
MAAVLHDTLEDTETTPEELERQFGPEVRALVEEMTDDQRLPAPERKRLQVEHAPALTSKAKLIKLGDKIANVQDITISPPTRWTSQRRSEYLDWTERVITGCRNVSPALEACYDAALAAGRRALEQPAARKGEGVA